jgi:hypothetical protein
VELAAFVEYHVPALEADEVRHNLMLGVLGGRFAAGVRRWSVGDASACAILSLHRFAQSHVESLLRENRISAGLRVVPSRARNLIIVMTARELGGRAVAD